MAAADFDTVADRNSDLIFKAVKGAVLLAPYSTSEAVTTVVATGGQINVPTGFTSVGWISDDGATFSRNTDTSDISGWGSGAFLRRDITSSDLTLQFTALETRANTMGLREGKLYTGTSAQVSVAGEWSSEIPDKPDVLYYRALTIGMDGSGDSLIYFVRALDKVMVSDMDDEVWSNGDDPINFNVTLSALPDGETGVVGRTILCGPGLLAKAVDMGFTVATS